MKAALFSKKKKSAHYTVKRIVHNSKYLMSKDKISNFDEFNFRSYTYHIEQCMFHAVFHMARSISYEALKSASSWKLQRFKSLLARCLRWVCEKGGILKVHFMDNEDRNEKLGLIKGNEPLIWQAVAPLVHPIKRRC